MNGIFDPTFSTNQLWLDENMEQCLTEKLDEIDDDIAALESSKADTSHRHNQYADINHEHSAYANKSDIGHTHSYNDLTNRPSSMIANGGNADTVGGYTPSNLVLNCAYPVGSTISTNNNTNPSTIYGGTWENTNKVCGYFSKNYYMSNNDCPWFTPSSNISNYTILLRRNNNVFTYRFDITTAAVVTDTAIPFGTISYSALGIIADPQNHYITGFSDGGNAVVMLKINSGTIETADVVGVDTLATDVLVCFEFTEVVGPDSISDSITETWCWTRTA